MDLKQSFDNFIKDKIVCENEIWSDVEETFGTYKISSKGRLAHWTISRGWTILKKTNKKGGYFSAILRIGTMSKFSKIHRLVAQHFIPNPKKLRCVNHIDGNKQNNDVNNLEWCTQKYNRDHAKNIGLWKYNHPYKCSSVYQYDLQGMFIAKYRNAKEAERNTGVCSRNILQVASKDEYNKKKHLVRKQAGGFIWRFNEEGGDADYEDENYK